MDINHQFNNSVMKSIQRQLEVVSKFESIANLQTWNQIVTFDEAVAVKNLMQIQRISDLSRFQNNFEANFESYYFKSIDKLLESINLQTYNWDFILQQTQNMLSNEIPQNRRLDLNLRRFDGNEVDKLPDISTESQQCIEEAVQSALSQPLNWQQSFFESIQRFAKTNPVVAYLLAQILVAIISMGMSLACNIIGQTINSVVLKESPMAGASSITRITADQAITIIGQQPYYYLAEFTDPVTGEQYCGYLSKRSVQLVDGDIKQ
ncbi:MAG: hypothetical protein RSF40_01820 [Oscillospiraceae bacterium]